MIKILLIISILSFNLAFSQSSGSWTQLNPPSQPSARASGMISRISDTEVLLFGGDDGTFNNQTWIFNKTTGLWTQLAPPSQPSGRRFAAMSRISDTEVLLFGGDNGVSNNETWIFNKTNSLWTQLNTPIQPSARRFAMMSRISDTEVLLFGGIGASNNNETWIFNNTSGSWTQLNTPNQPSARNNGKMSRISDTEVLLFGGTDINGRDDETWIFNNTSGSWTQLSPPSQPSARNFSMMTRISDTEVLLFGGNDGTYDNETWIFNKTSGSWTQLNPPSQPSPRDNGMMSRISDRGVLLFGGFNGSRINQTWLFELDPTPPVISNLTISNINNTSASFTSDVNYGGLSTTVTYEYGTSTGNYSATTSAIIIESNQRVSINQSNLTSNTEYFIRARAQNSLSTAYSSEINFTTLSTSDASNSIYSIENDGNQDGILDSLQDNVYTIIDGYRQTYITIISPVGTSINSVQTDLNNDNNFVYPFGQLEFKINASQAVVKLIFHGATDFTNYTYRKLFPDNKYKQFDNVTFSTEIIGGKQVAVATLTLVDGGAGDYDGIVNGVIYDPGGPALPVSANIPFWDWWYALLLIPILVYSYKRFS